MRQICLHGYSKRLITSLIWLSLLLYTPFSASAKNQENLVADSGIMDLAGIWKFKTGDDLRWADPAYDDSSWEHLNVPIPWGKQGHYDYSGIAWYRRTIVVPDQIRARAPGITLGFVDSSYELYLDGSKVGGAGSLPPLPRMEYDRIVTFRIPLNVTSKDGKLVLALRVWKAPEKDPALGGPYERKFLVGPIDWLVHREFLNEIPALLLSGYFFLVGLYHIHLFLRRRNLREYLWFGLLASFNAAFYTFLRSQWKYFVSENFLLLKELEYFCAFTLVPVFIQFLWPVLGRTISRPLRIYQILNVVVAVICLTPGLGLNLMVLPFWEISVVLFLPIAGYRIIREAIGGNHEARTISIGLLLAILTIFNDIAVDRSFIQAPRLIPYGFAAFVLTMALSLSNRFSRVYSELDVLRAGLEKRVEERTIQLSDQTRKTSEMNEKLTELNAKLSDVNAKLTERSRELGEASLAKSQFLANMSHELRTPLNAIIGYSEMIQEDAEDKGLDDLLPDVKKIREAGKHLLGIINDILDLSKIEAGNVALYVEPFKISMMIEDLGTTAAPFIERNNNKLEIQCREDLGIMRADIRRVRQVLLNLLSNAAKFTENGTITLSPSRDTVDGVDWIVFRVSDTGIGMTDEQKAKVFQAFSQADATATRKFGGTGLGLIICKRYCETMGGNISFESQHGKGSTFTVRLPAIVPESRTESSATDFLSEAIVQRAQSDGRGIVLVIDDDRSARDLMVRMISREGFRVVTAWGGEEGLRLARDLQPSLITLDVLMPGIDGWSVLKELKADPELGKIPVVMVTMEEDRGKGFLLGAADFVSKPINREQLSAVLNKYKR